MRGADPVRRQWFSWRRSRIGCVLSDQAFEKNSACDEIDGQPILVHQSCSDEDRVVRNESGLSREYFPVKGELHFISVLDSSLASGKKPLGGSKETGLHKRSQGFGQL